MARQARNNDFFLALERLRRRVDRLETRETPVASAGGVDPWFVAHAPAPDSFAGGAWETIKYADPQGVGAADYDPVTGLFTPPAGTYLVWAELTIEPAASPGRAMIRWDATGGGNTYISESQFSESGVDAGGQPYHHQLQIVGFVWSPDGAADFNVEALVNVAFDISSVAGACGALRLGDSIF